MPDLAAVTASNSTATMKGKYPAVEAIRTIYAGRIIWSGDQLPAESATPADDGAPLA